MNIYYWKRSILCALLAGAAATPGKAMAATEWRPGIPRTAFVSLFEWDWNSVARECTNYLGPKGFAAVQVSPPQEHPPGEQWWWQYQPVSYKLISRGGNRASFRAMVATCQRAGVDVYVDTVINHMANYNGGTGVGGSPWGSREFPAVPYHAADFHQPKCDIEQGDYDELDRRDVITRCDIPGLPDLNTGSRSVQDRIVAYLNDLYSLGVRGYRIDAAKHIAPADLAAIRSRLPADAFFTQEVLRDASVEPSGDLAAYQRLGQVNEFNYVYAMRNAFANMEGYTPSRLPEIFSSWPFMPSQNATVFVHNHDTERNNCSVFAPGGQCDSLSTYNGDTLFLAQAFMLAWPYGYPSVASGYYFNNRESGPPAAPYVGTETRPGNCSATFTLGKWDCVHRDQRVGNMVGFRNVVAGTAMSDWVSGTSNQIAFSRGNKGFIAINNSDSNWQHSFVTQLPDGRYCNVVAAENPETGLCPGAEISVSGGRVTVSLAPHSLLALHVGARPRPGRCDNPTDFSFAPVSGAPFNSWVKSNRITITGISCPAALSIEGGSYSIDGAPFTSANGSIRAGQTLQLQLRTPAQDPTQSHYPPSIATVTVGTDVQRFSVQVRQPERCDNPSDFSFTPVRDASFNSLVTSNAITIGGLRCEAALSVQGGTYSINGGPFTAAPGRIRSGQTLRVQVRTPQQEAGRSDYAATVASVVVGTDVQRFVVEVRIPPPELRCPATAPVCAVPERPMAGRPVTILYKGRLAGSGKLMLHWGLNGWSSPTDTAMTRRSDGLWSATIHLPAGVNALDFAVTDGFAWDNNGQRDWKIAVINNCTGRCDIPVTITFKVKAPTLWGESVYITGNHAALGNWSTSLEATRKCSPAEYPMWTCSIRFPGPTGVEYKYIKLGRGTVWEKGPNRSYSVPGAAVTRWDSDFRP